MKRFTVLATLLSISIFAAWAVLFAAPKSSESKVRTVPVYDATGVMLKAIHAGDNYKAIPVTGAPTRIVPVYDATRVMLDAINPNKKVITLPAYDATGAMPPEARP